MKALDVCLGLVGLVFMGGGIFFTGCAVIALVYKQPLADLGEFFAIASASWLGVWLIFRVQKRLRQKFKYDR